MRMDAIAWDASIQWEVTTKPVGTIRDSRDLFSAMSHVQEHWNCGKLWYRGTARSSYGLRPTVHRIGCTREQERLLLNQFRMLAHGVQPDCPDINDGLRWLVLMRHYGLPSRLLDWSSSALIAAFFAVGYEYADGPAAIWFLNPWKLNQEFYGDVGVLHLKYHGITELTGAPFDVEVPNVRKVAAVVSEPIDLRMTLQHAAFTFHGDPTPLEDMPNADEYLAKVEIAEEARVAIAGSLPHFGITASRVFPDLAHLARELVADELGDRLLWKRNGVPAGVTQTKPPSP
jgi:hypothetical protein